MDDDHFQMHYNHVHADLTVASKEFNVVKIQRYVQASATHWQKCVGPNPRRRIKPQL